MVITACLCVYTSPFDMQPYNFNLLNCQVKMNSVKALCAHEQALKVDSLMKERKIEI